MNNYIVKSNWKDNKEAIQVAKEIAMEQSDYYNKNGENIENVNYFQFLGHNIINPFLDETMRISFTTEEAYLYYGIRNMDYFVENVCKK